MFQLQFYKFVRDTGLQLVAVGWRGGIAKPVIPSTLCIWKDGLVADVEGREYPAEAAEGERHRE